MHHAALISTPSPAEFALDVQDLAHLAHLLPDSALELVRTIGPEAAVALMRGMPGVQLMIPKSADANPAGARRYEQLACLMGASAALALIEAYGGNALDVPVCHAAALEKRNRWIRQRFDHLTARSEGALSRRQAVYELGLELSTAGRSMTYRQIERAIEAADLTTRTGTGTSTSRSGPQADLFSPVASTTMPTSTTATTRKTAHHA